MDPVAQAFDILARVDAIQDGTGIRIDWKGSEQRARTLARSLGVPDTTLEKHDCLSCNLDILNAIRTSVGWGPLLNTATERLYKARVRTCHGDEKAGIPRCPNLSGETKLIPTFPFFQWKGLNCTLCGCLIHPKAMLNWEICEAGKWPVTA